MEYIKTISIFLITAIPFYLIYRMDDGGGVLMNAFIIYGYIITNGLTLFFFNRKSLEAGNKEGEGGAVSKKKICLFFAGFFLVSLFALIAVGKMLIVDGNFMREFGVFLSVLENVKNGLVLNMDFYYPYGALPIFILYLLDFVSNPVYALFSVKIFLDLFVFALLYFLLRELKEARIFLKTAIVFAVSGMQLFFFNPGSLHASPLRYLVLLLPLFFLLRFINNKRFVYFHLFLASPILCFLISPETGLISFVYALLSLLVLLDKKFQDFDKRKLAFSFWVAVFIFASIFANKTIWLFIKNSFQYTRSITEGLVSTQLPQIFSLLSGGDVIRLAWNVMFYLYLIPLAVLVFYCMSVVVKFFRTREIAARDFAILSLCFFALAYLFKGLGGMVGMSYESLTLFFVLLAFFLLPISSWLIKASRYILIIYVIVLLLPWAYFSAKYQFDRRQYLEYHDPQSGMDLLFSEEYAKKIEALKKIESGIGSQEKILLIADDAPGLYYLIGRPNHTHYINPGFVFSEETRKEFLTDLLQNHFNYIIISNSKTDYIDIRNTEKMLNHLAPFLADYRVKSDDEHYKVLIKK